MRRKEGRKASLLTMIEPNDIKGMFVSLGRVSNHNVTHTRTEARVVLNYLESVGDDGKGYLIIAKGLRGRVDFAPISYEDLKHLLSKRFDVRRRMIADIMNSRGNE